MKILRHGKKELPANQCSAGRSAHGCFSESLGINFERAGALHQTFYSIPFWHGVKYDVPKSQRTEFANEEMMT